MYGYFGYLLYMLPALILGLVAQAMVKSRFNKFSKIASRKGLTGAQAAQAVLNAGGVYNVKIGRVAGNLTDHYDPRSNSISLSDSVYGSTSVAAIGVAAHEAGHALQYAQNYSPIKLRMAIIPVCNLGSKIGPLLIILGAMISYGASAASVTLGVNLYLIGLVLFGTVALFQLVTLPVELNASKRAMQALKESGTLEKTELGGARKVLTAAALTYVAALVSSIFQILYYASRFRPNDRR